jgi:hypothetical protein
MNATNFHVYCKLSMAQRFDQPLVRPSARRGHFADQTQCGEWRRKQTGVSHTGQGFGGRFPKAFP